MKHAIRRLFKAPVFSLTAILTVGAAIGANALIFSVVNGVLLKPLPFHDPERLVGVWHVAPGLAPGPMNQSPATYFTYRENASTFEDVGLWDDASATVTGRGDPEQVDALYVTDGTLPLLGVRPALGRTFRREDDTPGGPDSVMLSYAYWQRAFQGRAAAIGQMLMVNGQAREVIGVLPDGFRFLRYNPAVVLPFRFNRAEVFIGNFSYQGVARLKPGVTLERANADVARLIPTIVERFPLPRGFTRQMFDEVRLGPLVRPLHVDAVGDIGRTLWILFGTVGIVLLVACANVANLFLVRAEARQHDLAVRLALGAGMRRVVRELLTEAMLLALAGGALGIALAYGGIRLLVFLEPARLPRLAEIGLDPAVLLFTVALSVVAGLLFGAIPVLKYARPELTTALKDSGRGSSDGRSRNRARNTLVVAQVALAVVLLVASGLMVRTFLAMRDVPPGFARPEEVFTMRISIPRAVVEDPARVARTHERIARRLQELAGVHSVGLSSSVPMDGGRSSDPIFVEDFPRPDGQLPVLRRFKWISEGYFETIGSALVAGRAITWSDIHTMAPVVAVSENFAREYWGDPGKAIGRRIRQNPDNPWREIVAVVANERSDGVTEPPPPTVYWPLLIGEFWDNPTYAQRSLVYAVRTSRLRDPGFLRQVQEAVWSVNPSLPLAQVRTLEEIYDESMAHTSFTLVVLAIAASVALLLGTVGIYGVIAYVVAQRRREIGIRMALGARGAEVQRMFVGRGMVVAGVGLAAGLALALGAMRLIRVVLFEVSPFDPLTYAAAASGLALVALGATWLPARGATTVDPALTLRGE